MRAHLIVVFAPRLDHHLRLGPRAEPFERQALVAKFAIEALRRSILPRFTRIDERRLDALIEDPLQKRGETNSGPLSERR